MSVLHQSGTTVLDGASYTYDSGGNRTAKTNKLNNVAEQYIYDAVYQLKQVTQGTTTSESYTYDAVGNRLSSLSVPSYSYNSSNELTSAVNLAFTYDNNGNMLTKTTSGATSQYTWDIENRLSSVVLPDSGGNVTFRYDSFGRKIQKSSATGTTNYLYDGVNALEEINGASALVASYTQNQGVDEPLAQVRSGASNYYEQDGLGSVTSLSNSIGSLANIYDYDSFGSLVTSTGRAVNPFQYSGRDYDSETGLRYYRARYYDSTIGRFLSEDPIRFDGGENFYPYVANNPTDFTDPSGLQHSPGGPWHPDPWIQYGCNSNDDCATLSWKIDTFKKLIASHIAWDLARGINRHAGDIAQHQNGLNWCILLHQAKCTNNCPKWIPAPEPQPQTKPVPVVTPQVVGKVATGATILTIIYWVVSEGSRIVFPPRNLIPIP